MSTSLQPGGYLEGIVKSVHDLCADNSVVYTGKVVIKCVDGLLNVFDPSLLVPIQCVGVTGIFSIQLSSTCYKVNHYDKGIQIGINKKNEIYCIVNKIENDFILLSSGHNYVYCRKHGIDKLKDEVNIGDILFFPNDTQILLKSVTWPRKTTDR